MMISQRRKQRMMRAAYATAMEYEADSSAEERHYMRIRQRATEGMSVKDYALSCNMAEAMRCVWRAATQ